MDALLIGIEQKSDLQLSNLLVCINSILNL